jgi:hypothetical protein
LVAIRYQLAIFCYFLFNWIKLWFYDFRKLRILKPKFWKREISISPTTTKPIWRLRKEQSQAVRYFFFCFFFNVKVFVSILILFFCWWTRNLESVYNRFVTNFFIVIVLLDCVDKIVDTSIYRLCVNPSSWNKSISILDILTLHLQLLPLEIIELLWMSYLIGLLFLRISRVILVLLIGSLMMAKRKMFSQRYMVNN